jgi:hypothetical protein
MAPRVEESDPQCAEPKSDPARLPKIFVFPDGDKYSGEARGKILEGFGVYEYHVGETYFGEYVDGKQKGSGVYSWSKTGDRYYGEFDRARQGLGVYTAAGGNKFSGEFSADQMNGIGVGEYSSGKSLFETRKGNKLISSVPFDPSNEVHARILRQATEAKATAELSKARAEQEKLNAELARAEAMKPKAAVKGNKASSSTAPGKPEKAKVNYKLPPRAGTNADAMKQQARPCPLPALKTPDRPKPHNRTNRPLKINPVPPGLFPRPSDATGSATLCRMRSPLRKPLPMRSCRVRKLYAPPIYIASPPRGWRYSSASHCRHTG